MLICLRPMLIRVSPETIDSSTCRGAAPSADTGDGRYMNRCSPAFSPPRIT